MYRLIFNSIIIITVLITSSCNSCVKSQNSKFTNEEKLDMDSVYMLDSSDAVFYALPSPEEIINYIKDNKVKFNPDLLHNSNMAKIYSSYDKKALICGIYFADLAYISAFKKSDFTGEYLSTIDYLLKELNISLNLTKEQQTRFLNSAMEPDSLYTLSRELYDTVINYLQEFDDGKTLSLLSIGSLTECLYITTYLNSNFKTQRSAINRIVEQKLLFEDVLNIAEKFKENETINNLIKDLKVLEKSYDNLHMESTSTGTVVDNDGTLNINGQNTFNVKEEDYYIFSDNLQDLRNKLIKQ